MLKEIKNKLVSCTRRYALVSASILLVSLTTACGGNSSSSAPKEPNIVEVAVANGSFTTLVTALQAAGLDTTLSDESGSFTVFAPTDAAFALLGSDAINALLADKQGLTDVLLYHVISGQEVDAATALTLDGQMVKMANEKEVTLTVMGNSLKVNNVLVSATDIMASNGIIHVLDAVLLPAEPEPEVTDNIVETAVANGSFTTLVAALQATGLDSTLADETKTFTVFAPTDDAFALLGTDTINALLADTDTLSDILLYHVIAGQKVDAATALTLGGNKQEMANGDDVALVVKGSSLMLNTVKVTATDIMTTNGIIHVLDAVLIPPTEAQATDNIVEVAVANGSFTTLVAALQATGLDSTLADENSMFTVFAPTDAAFDKLGDETIAALLADTDTLSNILLYHVIAGAKVDSITALTLVGKQAEMANMEMIDIDLIEGSLMINGSKVIITDVPATNGVIHVIDTVLTM